MNLTEYQAYVERMLEHLKILNGEKLTLKKTRYFRKHLRDLHRAGNRVRKFTLSVDEKIKEEFKEAKKENDKRLTISQNS